MFIEITLITISILAILFLFFWLRKSVGFYNNKLALLVLLKVIFLFISFILLYLGYEYKIINSFNKFLYFIIIYIVIIIFLDIIIKKNKSN